MKNNILKKICLFFTISSIAISCTPKITVKINGMALAPDVRMVSIPGKNLKIYYYHVRFFQKKIEANGNSEYIAECEPVVFTPAIAYLPKNTESVGINLYIENPDNLKYRLSEIKSMEVKVIEKKIYEGIRNDNYILLKCPLTETAGMIAGVKARLDLFDGAKKVHSIETSGLKYAALAE